jgi:hypothetical protein
VASGKAKTKKKTKTLMAQPKTKNGNRRNRQKNKGTVNPGMVEPGRNKTVNIKIGAIGGAAAAGAALAGGAAVISMPAFPNDTVQESGDDSSVPPGAVGIAEDQQPQNIPELSSMLPMPPIFSNSDEPPIISPDIDPELPPASPTIQPPSLLELLSMPQMPPMLWPADLQSSDDAPNISPDADPADAKEQKFKWLISRVIQNKPYSLDDPKLNLTDEEKSSYAKQFSEVPHLLSVLMGGGSSHREAADAAAAADVAQLFGGANLAI